MQQDTTRVPQTELFIRELRLLKSDVTANDRMLATEEFGIGKATVSRYLNGVEGNNDTAAKLISFFKARIAERNKVLQNV